MKIDGRILTAVACAALFTTACGGGDDKENSKFPASNAENTKILCSDNIDNDNNGLKDCDDAGCKDFTFCNQTEAGKENTLAACLDGIDNDGDTLPDCQDQDCSAFAVCSQPQGPVIENTVQLCSDNVDNDNNGTKDCDDANCKDFAFCAEAEPDKENTLTTCQDKEDNDGDGKIDCDDTECKAFTVCSGGGADFSQTGEESTVAACYFDGIDNDGDTLIDCDDPNCKIYTFCQELEPTKENTQTACTDKIDNDDDGYVDCDDPDCADVAACAKNQIVMVEETQTTCTDGIDNDDDGYVDCDDPGCAGVAACAKESGGNSENTLSKCTDGLDNDGDGDLDCLDADCQAFAICQSQVGVVENTRELCTDGKDNDFNGKTDKDDPNCALFYAGGGQYGENTVTLCGDGKDNDGDGVKDCDDAECKIFDICMEGYKKENDKCPDDPFKFKEDKCKCGETLVGEDCYINIVKPDDFDQLKGSDKKYIIKQNIDFGTTDRVPIHDFSGELDGGNKRISGLFNQKSYKHPDYNAGYCGLFGRFNTLEGKPGKLSNIDIAITLNCNHQENFELSLYAGALVGSFSGLSNDSKITYTIAENITGSSKVYVEEKPSETQVETGTLNRDIGGLFGRAYRSKISNVTLDGNVSANLTYDKAMKGLTSSSVGYRLCVGGVTGIGNVLTNVHANANVTVRRTNKSSYLYDFVGGIVGNATGDIENVSNIGVVKYIPSDWAGSTLGGGFVGGIAGITEGNIRHASFGGVIETNAQRGHYTRKLSEKKFGLNIGGILGAPSPLTSNISNKGIDHAQADAHIKAIASNSQIGGIVGSMGMTMLKGQYVRNSTARIDLELLPSSSDATDNEISYGGIIGAAEYDDKDLSNAVYIINNSAQTNYIQTTHHLATDKPNKNIGGISGKSGVVVNNFASDKLTCTGSCDYTPAAIGGAYVYESYWNKDVMGSDSGASLYSDASAQPYTYNVEGVPVTRTAKTVLGLLRYNAGYDGGVLSTHIPANTDAKYLNWTTSNDAEGHAIPVPAD